MGTMSCDDLLRLERDEDAPVARIGCLGLNRDLDIAPDYAKNGRDQSVREYNGHRRITKHSIVEASHGTLE